MHAGPLGETGSGWNSFTSTPAGWLDALQASAAARAAGGPATWRQGGRVADFEGPCIAWRKSTASNSGNCVQVAVVDGSVLIRDSVDPRVVLRLPPAAWSAFLAQARRKDFDLRRA